MRSAIVTQNVCQTVLRHSLQLNRVKHSGSPQKEGEGEGEWWRSWLRHCAPRREVTGSIPRGVFGNFQATQSFCPHSVPLGLTEHRTEMTTKVLPWGVNCGQSVQLTSAVLVARNVKVRMEAQHSVSPLSLRDLSRESFTYTPHKIHGGCYVTARDETFLYKNRTRMKEEKETSWFYINELLLLHNRWKHYCDSNWCRPCVLVH